MKRQPQNVTATIDNPAKNITYIYSQEQIKEITDQLPVNLQTCKQRIAEIDNQINQYDALIQQLEAKIQKADSLINDRCPKK